MVKLTLIADTHDRLGLLAELKKFLEHTQIPYDTVMEAHNLTEQQILAESELLNWLRRNHHSVQATLSEVRKQK